GDAEECNRSCCRRRGFAESTCWRRRGCWGPRWFARAGDRESAWRCRRGSGQLQECRRQRTDNYVLGEGHHQEPVICAGCGRACRGDAEVPAGLHEWRGGTVANAAATAAKSEKSY